MNSGVGGMDEEIEWDFSNIDHGASSSFPLPQLDRPATPSQLLLGFEVKSLVFSSLEYTPYSLFCLLHSTLLSTW